MLTSNTRRNLALVLPILCVVGLIAVTFAQNLKADVASQSPKDLYAEKCSACHNLPDPQAEAMSAAMWQATVNRMLYRHGAKDSISPDQATTIVTYLTTFAPKDAGGPARLRRNNPNFSDVWATDPVYSHVYRFRSADTIADFRNIDGKYLVEDLASGPQLFVSAMAQGKSALLIAPTPGPHADLQIEAEFAAVAPEAPAKAKTPVTFGLTFDTVDAGNYYVARYDDVKQSLDLARVQNGEETVIQSQPITGGLAKTDDGWHKLKVAIVNGRAKVWLDFAKKIDIALPEAPGSGAAGMWTDSRAAARSFTLDIYPTDVISNVAS